MDTAQVQVVSRYDNENSYTSQMVRTIKYLNELKSFVSQPRPASGWRRGVFVRDRLPFRTPNRYRCPRAYIALLLSPL